MVQKHFTDGTKSFYQAVNIKILKIIWKNKKEKYEDSEDNLIKQ